MKTKAPIINFKQVVKAMSAKEIILHMVEGLRNPVTKIDMNDYGSLNEDEGICYGCAATNTICRIAGVTELEPIIEGTTHNSFGEENHYFLDKFETAINQLRIGDIEEYNWYVEDLEIAKIKEIEGLQLPELRNNYTKEELDIYEQLANLQ